MLCTSAIWNYRAEYNPDQYLWEKDFTLAGRSYKRQDLEASMDINYQDKNSSIVFKTMCYFVVLSLLYYPFFNICSFRMQEAIYCGVVIIYLPLSLRILLFLVLYIATETGM